MPGRYVTPHLSRPRRPLWRARYGAVLDVVAWSLVAFVALVVLPYVLLNSEEAKSTSEVQRTRVECGWCTD